jgi:selenocysteine lyase/cysteine desulfurase
MNSHSPIHPLEDIRAEFKTVWDGVIFVNHAGVSILPQRCANAMKQMVDLNQMLQVDQFMQMMRMVEDCRTRSAELLNASPKEIALSRNTTEGINWVANGLKWKSGDRIVTVNGEYPANIYPWLRLQEQGVEVHMIQPQNGRITMDQIEAAITPNTKLVTLSFVDFVTGFRIDLNAVGELCVQKNVLFHADLIQGLGAVSVDVKQAKISFASFGGQKWLLGPMGAGIFYCNKDCLDLLEVKNVGATSVKNFIPYLDYDYTLRDDAKRFEYSASAVHAIAGLGASLGIFLSTGMDLISSRIKKLTDILVDGAIQKGYDCISPRGENEWSGIVSFKHPQKDTLEVVDQLRKEQIFTLEREGYIRLSPHFYHTDAEMHKIVDTL